MTDDTDRPAPPSLWRDHDGKKTPPPPQPAAHTRSAIIPAMGGGADGEPWTIDQVTDYLERDQ